MIYKLKTQNKRLILNIYIDQLNRNIEFNIIELFLWFLKYSIIITFDKFLLLLSKNKTRTVHHNFSIPYSIFYLNLISHKFSYFFRLPKIIFLFNF